MKHFFNILISCAMMLCLVACGNTIDENAEISSTIKGDEQITQEQANADNISTEIRRAISFGLVPEEIQGDYDKIITYRQYCEMLTNFMRVYDESRLSEWENTISLAAQSEQEMKREDGILVIAYAMVHMDKIEYSGNDWEFFDTVGAYMDTYGYDLTWDYPLFPNWEDIAFEWINSNYIQGGLNMCAVERSRVSGLPIYPYDFEREGKHLKDNLTREEAISAVLRFAETEDIYADNLSVPENTDFSVAEAKIEEINALVEKRKQNILENKEAVSCTGTAYYVSNSGDDNNDGKSPETAWATLDKVNSHIFQSGDGIYFERNGIWRGAVNSNYDNILISAYDEGDKPRIYGSPENGADASKWELYSESNDVKIWKYKGINSECAGIVLNDGEKVAKRVYAWYDGQNYYNSSDMTSVFDMNVALCENLYFYCDMNLGKEELPYYPNLDDLSIQIYLRCDEGNPGEIYDSIEFISKTETDDVGTIVFGENCILDNICIMYNAGTSVSMTEHDNCTIQNCEFAWCGTRLDMFFEPEEYEPGIWTDGNVIQLIGSNCTVQNNYIHDVDGGGIVFELGGDISERVPFTGNVILGNLIERCGDPLYIRNNDQDEEIAAAFGEMKIDNNYIIDTGYGWYENQPSYINPAFYNGHSRNALNYYGDIAENSTINITNNIFCRAYHSLLYFTPSSDTPICEGSNIYVQNYGKTIFEGAGAMVKATQPDEIKKSLDLLEIDVTDISVLKAK